MPAQRKLADRTVALLKAKHFEITNEGTCATYFGPVTIDVTWPDEGGLELCFTLKDGTLYAKPNGVLLAEKNPHEHN